MKKGFEGYYKKSDKELKSIWDTCLFTFDANVLLNMYRYSENTRKHFISTFSKFSPRLFLTHQAVLEFYNNRIEVITEQQNAYVNFSKELKKIDDSLQAKSRHPFLSETTHGKLNKTFAIVHKELEDSREYYGNVLKNDIILEEMFGIFSGKVTNSFNPEELEKIHSSGKQRYIDCIPPGYEDKKDKEGNKIYGDYVLWKQIIKHSVEHKQPIVLVTDDKKADWWWVKSGKTIGPRPELVKEFFDETANHFHMYTPEQFLEFATGYLNEKRNVDVINEVQQLKSESELKREENLKKLFDGFKGKFLTFFDNTEESELDSLHDKLYEIKNKRINTYKLELEKANMDKRAVELKIMLLEYEENKGVDNKHLTDEMRLELKTINYKIAELERAIKA